MLRRTHPKNVHRIRWADNLEVNREGKNMSGMMQPYRIWMWKQNEMWRGIQEGQFEHLRRVYKRQWLEAFRVNADEYISKYNQTKAAQYAAWEAEMEDQDQQRRDALHMSAGRHRLREKHRDILQEFYERHFFQWYERASERLQYMSKSTFITPENVDAHIQSELRKYVSGKEGSYPLNFAGQMPFLENEDLKLVEAPEVMASHYEAFYSDEEMARYTPPATLEERDAAFPVSAEVVDVTDADARAVADEVVTEAEQADEAREAMEADEMSEEESEKGRMSYVHRGKFAAKHRKWKGGSSGRTVGGAAGDLPQKAAPTTSRLAPKAGDTVVKPSRQAARKKPKVDNISVLKEFKTSAHGATISEEELLKGARAAGGMPVRSSTAGPPKPRGPEDENK